MTQILNLPLLSFPMTIGNNEDWTDSWAYIDASSNPISLAGLTLVLMVRKQATDAVVYLLASTVSGPINGLQQSGSITIGGDGLNIVALEIPKASVATVLPGAYVFEVQAMGDSLTRTVAQGALTILAGVVR